MPKATFSPRAAAPWSNFPAGPFPAASGRQTVSGGIVETASGSHNVISSATIVSGSVIEVADGGELTLTIIGPGASLGELSVADGGPRSADAETLEECRLIFIPRQTVLDTCARVPSVAEALTGALAATLRRLTEATSDLIFLDMPRRVAKVLLGQPRGDDGVLRLALTQEELAHQVGSTRQSVNAALRGFEKRGWIDVHGRSVTVKQAEALSRFAGN